jgi:hypothetical protein
MLLSSSVWRGNARWWFAGGELLGGIASGLVGVVAGSLLLRWWLPTAAHAWLIACALVAVAAHEFGIVRLPLPQNARQVPQWVIDEGGRFGALQFGFEMGTGARTFMTSGLPHLVLLAVLLIAAWPHALLAGLAFGAGRAWMALSRLWSPDPAGWDATLRRRDAAVRAVLVVAAGFVALLVA